MGEQQWKERKAPLGRQLGDIVYFVVVGAGVLIVFACSMLNDLFQKDEKTNQP